MNRIELLTRLRAATGPDRELDADIERAFFVGAELDAAPWEYRGKGFWIDLSEIDGFNTVDARKFTESIDAAVALAERALPGWKWLVSSSDLINECEGLSYASVWLPEADEGNPAKAPTPALALCIAIVEALEARARIPGDANP